MHHDAQNNWGKMEFNKYIFQVLTCFLYRCNVVIEHLLSMGMNLGLISCTILRKGNWWLLREGEEFSLRMSPLTGSPALVSDLHTSSYWHH